MRKENFRFKSGLFTILFGCLSCYVNSQTADTTLCKIKSTVIFEPTLSTNYESQTALSVLSPMRVDYLMRGFFKWGYIPVSVYSNLQTNISQIKTAKSGLIYGGGISASFIDTTDQWPNGSALTTGDVINCRCDTSGFPIHFGGGYLGDIAKPLWRKFLIGWSKKQIDAGIDAIFYDENYRCPQMKIFYQNANPTTLLNQYGVYFKEIADSVRNYAVSKGKKAYITMNGENTGLQYTYTMTPASVQMLDFVTLSFNPSDFSPPYYPQQNWNTIKSHYDSLIGRTVPMVAFIDWAGACQTCALTRFDSLTTTIQKKLLHRMDSATKSAGVLLAYPVYGGNARAGNNDTVYDAVRKNTYDTLIYMSKHPSSLKTCNSFTGINLETLPGFALKVYPNPCNEIVTIEVINYPFSVASVSIRDMFGNEKKRAPAGEHKIKIDLQGLSPGIYFLYLIQNSKMIFVKKLILSD